MNRPLTPPGPQVHAASLTAATAGFALWTVQEYLFHGNEVPGPVYAFLHIAVPSLLGRFSAQLTYWRARSHLDFPPGDENARAPRG